MKYSIVEERERLTIIIAAKRFYLLLGFFPLFAVAWIGLGAVSVRDLLAESGKGFSPGWVLLGVLTFLGVQYAYLWVWMVSGKETVVLDGRALTYRRTIGRFAVVRRELSGVRNVRGWDPIRYSIRDPRNTWEALKVVGGNVAFEAKGKTYWFGLALTECDAEDVVERIVAKYPWLKAEANY